MKIEDGPSIEKIYLFLKNCWFRFGKTEEITKF